MGFASWALGFEVKGAGFGVQVAGFRVSVSGCRVQGLEARGQGVLGSYRCTSLLKTLPPPRISTGQAEAYGRVLEGWRFLVSEVPLYG